MNKFKKDKNYLLKAFIINIVIFSLINIVLFKIRPIGEFKLYWYHSLVVLSGVVLGLISVTAFHNTVHGNIHPRLLNTIIGEITANVSLEDFRCFKVGHLLHHMNPDDPILDPHPPAGLSFIDFLKQSRNKTIECITNFYYKNHGRNSKTEKNVSAQIISFHFLIVAKLVFWFLLFGPVLFTIFYLPAYLTYFFSIAHINYVAHREEDGSAGLQNHDDTLYYKVVNVITSGVYYHKNHHAYPNYYNPSKIKHNLYSDSKA
jgi:fatty acid desaturase